jgi:L-asparaginase/Glu-tRNA(Gln) amidotransferase subunit D
MLTFDPTQFILNNATLFTTVGVVVAIGTFTLALTAIVVMLALRSDR